VGIWQEVGAKVGNPPGWSDATVDAWMAKFASKGGGYVLVQSSNGPISHIEYDVLRWKNACAKYGRRFGIWNVTYTDPHAEALQFVADIVKYKPEGASINAEVYYHGDPNQGGDQLVRWNRNLQFLDAFAAASFGKLLPPLSLNTLGAASGQNVYWMPHDRWLAHGFDVHAQAYYNAWDDYRPDLCVAHWLRAGYPLDRIALTLGTYQAESGSKGLHYHVSDYLPLLGSLAIKGVNLFTAEALEDDRDFDWIPNLIVKGHALALAPLPPPPPSFVDVHANRRDELKLMKESIDYWRATGKMETAIAVYRQTLAWRVLNLLESGTNVRAVAGLLDTLGAPRP